MNGLAGQVLRARWRKRRRGRSIDDISMNIYRIWSRASDTVFRASALLAFSILQSAALAGKESRIQRWIFYLRLAIPSRDSQPGRPVTISLNLSLMCLSLWFSSSLLAVEHEITNFSYIHCNISVMRWHEIDGKHEALMRRQYAPKYEPAFCSYYQPRGIDSYHRRRI